jgi:hypothetical protein
VTLRAGTYNANQPSWRGVIRDDGFPWYVCTHRNHADDRDAKRCAREALPALKNRDHANADAPLPDGWRVYVPGEDRR